MISITSRKSVYRTLKNYEKIVKNYKKSDFRNFIEMKFKGRCRRPIEAFPRRGHVTTYISLERSHRVEQLCPLGQSDPRTTGSARRRQSRKFFSQIFFNLKVSL